MTGLLAAALGGAGQAVQTNAKMEIKKRKEAALMGLRQKYTMQQQNDQQQFSTSDRIAGQDFTAQENSANRAQQATLASQREAGANSRSAMAANEIVPTKNGGYGLLNTASGDLVPLPEDVDYQGSGKLTEREDALARNLQTRIEAIDERVSGRDRYRMSSEQIEQLETERNQYQEQLDGLLNYQAPSNQQPQKASAPNAAIDYLRQNNSPAMRSAFREKFGYLPEDL